MQKNEKVSDTLEFLRKSFIIFLKERLIKSP